MVPGDVRVGGLFVCAFVIVLFLRFLSMSSVLLKFRLLPGGARYSSGIRCDAKRIVCRYKGRLSFCYCRSKHMKSASSNCTCLIRSSLQYHTFVRGSTMYQTKEFTGNNLRNLIGLQKWMKDIQSYVDSGSQY